MKTSVDEIGKNKVRLTVEVPSDELKPFVDRTYRRLAGQVKVPGFRPGHVPRPILDQRLGKDYVRSEALREALPQLFEEAVKEAEIDVVAPPELDIKSFEEDADLAFEAVVEVRPTPELKEYTGLKVTRPSASVTDEEVPEQIERLRTRYASLEVVERPLRKGDFALIDLNTYRHNETIEELTAKDLLVEVGAEQIVPELDAELGGKRKGDILKLATTLPDRFGDRAGWQVGMQVLVKEVKARNLPPLDDELAKTVSEFDTLEELRTDLRDRIGKIKEHRAEQAVRERTIDAFVEHGVEVDLPEGMVALEVDRLIRQTARVLEAQRATLEQYLAAEKIDLDALRQRLRPQAERNLTLHLGLQAVAARERIQATDDDRAQEIERLASGLRRETEDVRKMVDDSGDWASIDGDIIRAKALDLMVSRAEITEEEGSA